MAVQGAEQRPHRQELVGIVVSDKMAKTVVVEVERLVSHPQYKRVVKERLRVKAHDEKGEAHAGDRVRLAATRPMSKEKRWRVAEIVERAR